VLDTGDIIHTKLEGRSRLKLKVGDVVRTDGVTRPLSTGSRSAIEAIRNNGKLLK
jgi:ribosomal protein S17